MSDQNKTQPSSKDTSSSTPKSSDWPGALRTHDPTPGGRILFAVLRTLDLPLQYYLLRSALIPTLIRRLGGTPVPQTNANTTFLGLSPYQTIIFGLAAGSAAKHAFWSAFTCETAFPAKFAAVVAVYNTLVNTLNTVSSLWSLTSQDPDTGSAGALLTAVSSPSLIIGTTLYTVGLLTEWWCEIQRRRFKADPANKGRPYSGGLFGLARNINYGGYTLWRSGYALVCGGWLWAGTMCAWVTGDFVGRAIPAMDDYCSKRYGEHWVEVRKKVPYKLLPWIY